MDLYEVLEKRRTYRDFSDREVSDEIVKKNNQRGIQSPDQRPPASIGIHRGAHWKICCLPLPPKDWERYSTSP